LCVGGYEVEGCGSVAEGLEDLACGASRDVGEGHQPGDGRELAVPGGTAFGGRTGALAGRCVGRPIGRALYGLYGRPLNTRLGDEQVQQVCDDGGRDRGPGADAEPQGGRRDRADAAGEVARLREPGQPGRDDDDGPGVAARAAVEPGGRGVGDEGEPVCDEGVEPGDPGRDTRRDGDLVQTVRGGDRRADRDEQTGQPDGEPRGHVGIRRGAARCAAVGSGGEASRAVAHQPAIRSPASGSRTCGVRGSPRGRCASSEQAPA
jgi:hypothetical protein